MLLLALDTTTRRGSIALTRDDVLIETFIGDASITHGERLPGDLLDVLHRNGLRLADVDLFAVAAGPGSFTGLRVGIAIQQGLALANDRPLIGVSALDALYEAAAATTPVAVWMDAQRGEVFSAVYAEGQAIEPPVVERPHELLARWRARGLHWPRFAGDGAVTSQDAICREQPAAVVDELVPPLAPSVARLAIEEWRRCGGANPDAIRPIYIRRSDAELARDRRARAQETNTGGTPAAKPASA